MSAYTFDMCNLQSETSLFFFLLSLGLGASDSAWVERWQQDLSRQHFDRRHLDGVLTENEGLRSSIAELQTRLENADRVVQELQSAKEGFGRWGLDMLMLALHILPCLLSPHPDAVRSSVSRCAGLHLKYCGIPSTPTDSPLPNCCG